eukprot:gene13108-27681_t
MEGIYDAKADIFSLGIVLLELLSGHLQRNFRDAQGNMRPLENAIDNGLVPDVRAGIWNDDCARILLTVARGCVAQHADRTRTMVEVLRPLRLLEQQYCGAVNVNVDPGLLQQIEASKKQSHEEQDKRLVEGNKVIECVICFDSFIADKGLHCRGIGAHFLCHGCFSNQVTHQIGPYSRADFLQRRGKIACAFCFTSYEERDVASFCNGETYTLYRAAYDEILVANVIRQQQQEHQAQLDALRREMERMGGARQEIIARHRLHIVEKILTLHCPRVTCGAAFLDFDGCFAVRCSTCHFGFCGWCLKDCGRDAHAHVKTCRRSMQRGGLNGTQAQFNQIHSERRKGGVRAYIRELAVDLQQEVKQAVAGDLVGLNIAL